MKKIVFILGLSFLISSASAQTPTIDTTLNKFVGGWRWNNGSDTIDIVLRKQVYIIPRVNSHTETLVGWMRYVKNGVIQQSTFQHIDRDINLEWNENNIDPKHTLLGSTRRSNTRQVLFTTFWDASLHKQFELYFTLLPNSLNQASWKLNEPRGIYTGPNGTAGLYTLPRNIVLNKY